MRPTNMKNAIFEDTTAPGADGGSGCRSRRRLTLRLPESQGPTFNLTAQTGLPQPARRAAVYSWGYGCTSARAGFRAVGDHRAAFCSTMQVPGPTLIVTEGRRSRVTLTNGLPTAAGNTSILFPGFTCQPAAGGVSRAC